MRYKNEYKVSIQQRNIADMRGGSGVYGNASYAILQALKVLPEVLQEKFIKTYNEEYEKYFLAGQLEERD